MGIFKVMLLAMTATGESMLGEREIRGKIIILKVIKRLDTSFAPEFEKECLSLIGEGHIHLVVDLEKVDYLSSAGLRALLRLLKEVEKLRGKMLLCGLQRLPREVFEMSGFMSLFEIEKNIDEAVARMESCLAARS